MDQHAKLRAQIRAGRELLNLKQADLAEALGTSLSRISRAESGETKSGDTLLEIKGGLERAGIRFTASGVEVAENRVEIMEGEGCYLRLLDDVLRTLKKEEDKTLLIMFASDRASPPEVNERYRALRRAGVKMRQLIEETDSYVMGALEEYRTIPSRYFTNVVTLTYADKVAQVDSAVKQVTIHSDVPMAQREKKLFSYLWDIGKKPEKSDATERF